MNENRGDGSYQYENPLILDESGEVFGTVVTLTLSILQALTLIQAQTIQMVGNICLNKRLKVTLKTDIEKEEYYA